MRGRCASADDHRRGTLPGCQRGSEEFDALLGGLVCAAQADDHDPVLSYVDKLAKSVQQQHVLGRGKVALEDRVLNGVAEPVQLAEYHAQALGIGDVVADQVAVAHGGKDLGEQTRLSE